jgi:activating signal cointegrator 1
MKAISIQQPWATLIAHGVKKFETRGWRIKDSMLGERIAIHAGKSTAGIKQFKNYSDGLMRAATAGLQLDDLPLGAVIATARIAYVMQTDGAHAEIISGQEKVIGDWSANRYAWRFTEVVQVKPYPCRGKLSIFDIPELSWHLEALHAQLDH